MKRAYVITIVILSVVLLSVGGLLHWKHQLLKTQPANAIAVAQKEKTPLDLRPAAIARLQRLISNASDGLYRLRIDSLFTELSSGSIILKGVGLYPDSTAMVQLHQEQKLPDDVYQMEMNSLRISGIGLADIVHHRKPHFCCVAADNPRIAIHHKLQPYNADERARAKRELMFSRLHAQIDRLQVDTILVRKGTVTDYADGRKNEYKDVSINLSDVLIDSAAEKDQTRFLFAKKAIIQAWAISMPADKSGYDLSMDGISIYGERRQVIVRNLKLHPHAGREAFVRSQKERKCVYDVTAPEIVLNRVNWWASAHGESLIADEAEVSNARVNVYMDQRIPAGPVEWDDFPHQKLGTIPKPVSVKRVHVKGTTVTYEQYTVESGKQTSMSFNDIDLVAEHATNLTKEVAAQPAAHAHATCRFMNATPMTADFVLYLPKSKQGAFKVSMDMGELNPDQVNRFSEGMGLVRFSSGHMEKARAQLTGDDYNLHGNISVRYTDLHLQPLKPNEDAEGHPKEKHVSSKVANLLFVKNNNPGRRSGMREPDFVLKRTKEANFFGFVWEGLKLGLLKTAGIPPKLGNVKAGH